MGGNPVQMKVIESKGNGYFLNFCIYEKQGDVRCSPAAMERLILLDFAVIVRPETEEELDGSPEEKVGDGH